MIPPGPPSLWRVGQYVQTTTKRTNPPPQRKESFYSIFSRKNCGSPEGSALWCCPHRTARRVGAGVQRAAPSGAVRIGQRLTAQSPGKPPSARPRLPLPRPFGRRSMKRTAPKSQGICQARPLKVRPAVQQSPRPAPADTGKNQ